MTRVINSWRYSGVSSGGSFPIVIDSGDYHVHTRSVLKDRFENPTLPFPDSESVNGRAHQFVFRFGYDGLPTNYPDLYGKVYARVYNGSTTLIEWNALVDKPSRPTTFTTEAGVPLTTPYTSDLTPAQTPLSGVRGGSFQYGDFGVLTTWYYAQGNTASKKALASYQFFSPFRIYVFSVYSDVFEMEIPNGSEIEVRYETWLPIVTPNQSIYVGLFDAAPGLMPITATPNELTVGVRGTTPADRSNGVGLLTQTVAAGFYWFIGGDWVRVGDFSTIGGTINDRTIEYDSEGVQDIYSFYLDTNGFATFIKAQATTTDLGLRPGLISHPNGFLVSALASGNNTLIESRVNALSGKETLATISNVRPHGILRDEDTGYLYMMGRTSTAIAFFQSTNDGYTWTQMASPFDSTYSKGFPLDVFGGIKMAVAHKAGQFYIKNSYNNGVTWETPDDFTPVTLPSGAKPGVLVQGRLNGVDTITYSDNSTYNFESYDTGGHWSAV